MICDAGRTGAKRGSWRTQPEHWCGRTDDEDGGWLDAADGTAAPTPAGSQGRNKERRRKQTTLTVSSPPCGVPEVLLIGREAAEREIDGSGRALGFAARCGVGKLGS
jgi:hypothetical protein